MDEEIIQRVIYIVIVVAILIVNFAARSRKKKLQVEQQKQTSQNMNQEMPSTPVSDARSLETEGYEVFRPIENEDTKTITSNNIQASDTFTKKSSRMESNYQSRMTKLHTKQIKTLEVEEETFKFSPDELKKAIIYSEILAKREY